jgi:hypothetical protein
LLDDVIYESPIEEPLKDSIEVKMIDGLVFKAFSVKGLLKDQNSQVSLYNEYNVLK